MKGFSIYIQGSRWKIIFGKVPKRYLEKGQTQDDLAGLCCYNTRTIWVRPGEDELMTLVHELVHATFPFLKEEPVAALEEILKSGFDIYTKWQA